MESTSSGSTHNDIVKAHLNYLLDFPGGELSQVDSQSAKTNKPLFILDKLLNKKFRRAPVHPERRKDIEAKVNMSIKANEPIYLIICFGGYKHFWNASHPKIDFAELFNLHFMSEYVAPILKVHEPGVVLDYESEDVIIPAIDNYPKKSLDEYSASFRALLSAYQERCNLPPNFKINLVRPQELEYYKKQDYETRLFKRIEERRANKIKTWEALSDREQQERLHRTPRSIMWKGEKDLSGLNDKEKEKWIVRSKIDNEIYYDADFEFRGEYLTGGNHIPLVLSWGLCEENAGHWLTIASTKASTVDFWIGRGILDIYNGKVLDRVISQRQYKKIKPNLKVCDGFEWADASTLENLKTIDVLEDNDFTKLITS